MISGQFVSDASPFVEAQLRVPRLAVSGTLYFLMDTGADVTSLHLRDVLPLMGQSGLRRLARLGNLTSLGGIGGSADYFVEPAQLVFTHDDGKKEGFTFDLRVAKPARRGSRKRSTQLAIPSLLGKDIMTNFDVVFDWPHVKVYLDHN